MREVDAQSLCSSTSRESIKDDGFKAQIKMSSTESEEGSDKDVPMRRIPVEGRPPKDQFKFLVFEEAVVRAFGKCRQCTSECTVSIESLIGSSCRICSFCKAESAHYFEWTTGPLVNKMPVFHLLFATGILATGMKTAKVLRLFKALKIPNVQQQEVSDILKAYVILAVYKVWHKEQSAQLEEIEGKPIVIASDMRVDSLGHSSL